MRFGQGRGVEILPSIGGFANGRRHGAKESINVYQTENGTVAKKYNSFPIITPAIKHCHCGHWNHQVLDRVRESGDQSMTGRASGFVTVMT